MKVLTVVGARPQFIKAAMVSRVLRTEHTEILVHTGQHYDDNMSGRFFRELHMPQPDYNLGISGGSHGEMTGQMLIKLEEILVKETPDWLLVYGDTNSTLAAALAAAKLHIPICHVEAGCRTHSSKNPEEINRICTDHISSLLLPCTQSGVDELVREGLKEATGQVTGDLMYDAFLRYRNQLNKENIVLVDFDKREQRLPEDYYYLTCHREENTNDDSLRGILEAMEQLDAPVIYPVHPRNRKKIERIRETEGYRNTVFTEPIGYLDSICMLDHAEMVITDSGGLQREAFFAEKKCVTVFDYVIWPETMVDGRNELARADRSDILEKLGNPQKIQKSYQPFGTGHAAERIVAQISDKSDKR